MHSTLQEEKIKRVIFSYPGTVEKMLTDIGPMLYNQTILKNHTLGGPKCKKIIMKVRELTSV